MGDAEQSVGAGAQSREPGWPQLTRASLLTGFGAVEAASAQMANGFSRLMLGALFLLNIGAILGLGALLAQLPPDAVEAAALGEALHLFLYAFGAGLLAAAAGFWSAEYLGLAVQGLRNREVELLNRALPGVAAPTAHELEAQRWNEYAAKQGRRLDWAFFLCWGLGALSLALTVWGLLTAADAVSGARATAPAPEPALLERITRLETLLELHPRWGSAPEEEGAAEVKLLERIELLERQLELNPVEGEEPAE